MQIPLSREVQTWKFLVESLPPHPLAEEVLRFLQLNIKIKVITVLSSRTWATNTYYQVSFLNNLRFLQTKDMRHTLDPLHCYSLGIHRNAGKVTLQMLGRCSEAVGVDVVHYENMQKRTELSHYWEIACVGVRPGDLEKGYLCYFPKSVLGLLGDAGKRTFLHSTTISPPILWEQYYWPYSSGDWESWIQLHAECFMIYITDCGWELTVSLSWCDLNAADFEPLIFQY